MTNETSVVEKVTGAIGAHFNEGKDMADQVTTWLTEKGLDFALNFVFALIILLVGWLAIKLISLAVRKALMRGKAKGRLLADFVVSVVTKACWAVLIVMVLGRLGVNVTPLIAGLGVTGFILGFAFHALQHCADVQPIHNDALQGAGVRLHFLKLEAAPQGGVQCCNGSVRRVHGAQKIHVVGNAKRLLRVGQLGRHALILPQALRGLNQGNQFAKDLGYVSAVDFVNDKDIVWTGGLRH